MPARNASATIRRSVMSTLNAMPSDSELAIWDDASSDDTRLILDQIRDRRLRYFTTDNAVGSGVGRAKLMEASDSEYVACMDADDVCLPWRFREENLPQNGADIQFTPLLRFGRALRHFRYTRAQTLDVHETPFALLIHNPLAQPSMIAKRSVISSIGGYSAAKLGQDYELWLRAAADGARMRRSGLASVAYRVSPGQVTQLPDYRRRFTADPLLRSSYWRLVSKLFSSEQISADSEGFSQLRRLLLDQVGKFTKRNRPYYLRLLTRGSPLGLEP